MQLEPGYTTGISPPLGHEEEGGGGKCKKSDLNVASAAVGCVFSLSN